MRETVISADRKGTLHEDGFVFNIKLPPQSEWAVTFDVAARGRRADIDELDQPKKKHGNGDSGLAQSDRDVSAFVGAAPCLVASWEPLNRIYKRSLIDLAALRFSTGVSPGTLPAAGLPWFMAVFGRDSLFTSFQALTFAPELAATTLRRWRCSRAHATIRSATRSPARSCTRCGSAR